MKKYVILLIIPMLLVTLQCGTKKDSFDKTKAMNYINKAAVDSVIEALIKKHGEAAKFRMEKGVNQVASFWTEADGTAEDFEKFCMDNFIAKDEELDKVFERLSNNFEILSGNFNKINLDLKRPLDLEIGEMLPIDMMFGSYSPASHVTDDFFQNKIAFTVVLNFPFYTLKEKTEQGADWSRKQWAYARMGDIYTSRVPAELNQKASKVATEGEAYIAEYNIYMGNLIDDNNKTYFAEDLKLITHWGLRDELKSHYNKEGGVEKQKMVYAVMKNIITQEIPECVINNNEYQWNPYKNIVFKKGKKVDFKPEPDTRYKVLLDNFQAMREIDKYSPQYSTYIQRAFDEGMEMSQEDVEKLFIGFVSSPQVKKVAKLISKRLGRNLEPFDIWYDGFKARSSISEVELNKLTKTKYPTREAFEKDLPNILVKLGFTAEKAQDITSKISVDASRGAGHAWGAQMKSDKAHLRTRIGADGMDYKGYNIAVHEFGHNVEQTITLQYIDYYMLRGVPNTAFTEAVAFNFQKRDLELLGMKDNTPNKKYLLALDNFWSSYEIMGVSLVDMNVWKWLYENPDATPAELKEAVINIAKDIWNKYYADVFGVKDQPILAIYSHMIDNPLYLSAYPVGHLIEFQFDEYMQGKNFAKELERILLSGDIVPQQWMKIAVGREISIEPTVNAAEEALKYIK